jgi:hypothetical protein
VQRIVGLAPVLVVSLAAVISAAIGLGLSDDASPRSVADELGCHHVSSGTSATGVSQEICTYHGDRIIIWSFGRGSNVVYPVGWMESGVEGARWIIGCANAEDCVAIRDRLGGRLLTTSWLGTSIEGSSRHGPTGPVTAVAG